MEITPDQTVFWTWAGLELNATIVFSWVVMAVLVLISWIATRRLRTREPGRLQLALELIVETIRDQIRDAAHQDPKPYIPFIGTLFLFIATSTLLGAIPGFTPPTASLSTTSALAACVFVAVPIYGIAQRGLVGYLRHYVQPTPFMLPFQVISEFSRTLALAMRLFGNIMSGTLIVGILISLIPFLFPAVMEAFGLLIGFIQAYVFAVLSLVYIASAARSHREVMENGNDDANGTRDED